MVGADSQLSSEILFVPMTSRLQINISVYGEPARVCLQKTSSFDIDAQRHASYSS
jgi:hypothetical protein